MCRTQGCHHLGPVRFPGAYHDLRYRCSECGAVKVLRLDLDDNMAWFEPVEEPSTADSGQ